MKKVLKIIFNKFLITGILFAVWMIYFDQNNWSSQEKRKKQLWDVEQNIAYLNSEITRMEQEHNEMIHNPEKLEKFAREQYKMKRDNEDLYIVEQ